MQLRASIRPKCIKFPPKLFAQISRTGRHGSSGVPNATASHETQVGHASRSAAGHLLVDIDHPHTVRQHAHPHHHLDVRTQTLILPLGLQLPHHDHLIARIAPVNQIIAQFDQQAPRHAADAIQRRRRFLHLHLLVIRVLRSVRHYAEGRRAAFVLVSERADRGTRKGVVRGAEVGVEGELVTASLAETSVGSDGFHHAHGAGADARSAYLHHGADVGGGDG
mmetsp:Transcript_22647/g.42671  ORF Transcript_22647/g.42671 Transcript_22647/m.42671 type:complete len:222 (+) Transcript_22647:1307-1972(+)